MKNIDRKIKLLLVEDDQRDCRAIIAEVDRGEDFLLIGVTDSANKALELTVKYAPDAVILDPEMRMGEGFAYLKSLRETNLSRRPFILVTTNNTSDVIHRAAKELGADFIMLKSRHEYSAVAVAELLKTIKPAVLGKTTDTGDATTDILSDKRLRAKICDELNKIGIPTNCLGYKYLLDAILAAYDGRTERLCALIAKKYGKTECSVERAMQNAINRAWVHSDPNDFLTHYTAKIRSEKAVPSKTEFVFFYANKIRNEL